MFVSVIRTKVKNSSLFFVQIFWWMSLFMHVGVDIKLSFFDYRPKTKIHKSHHTFFSRFYKKLLLLWVFNSNLSVSETPAKHIDDLKFDIWENGLLSFRFFDNFLLLVETVKTWGVFRCLSINLKLLFEFFGVIIFAHSPKRSELIIFIKNWDVLLCFLKCALF